MINPAATFVFLAAMAGGPDAGEADPLVPVDLEAQYAMNACVQCHRAAGGRLAQIVDQGWAKSIHYKENTSCEQCHGGDASLTRDAFLSEEEFKAASHASFKVEFLYLRDRWETGKGLIPEQGYTYLCGECHDGTIRTTRENPHGGLDPPACPFPDWGISTSRSRGIAYICASCHPEATEKHLGSPHGSFGAPSCLFCHGDGTHAIPPVTIDIIDTRPRAELGRCSPCHKPGTMNVVSHIRETLEESARLIEASGVQFAELQQMGYRNLALGEMHRHIDEFLSSLRRVVHGSNIREIDELARSIKHVAKHTAYAHELVKALNDARRRQTKIAIATAGLLLVLAGMLVVYRRVYC